MIKVITLDLDGTLLTSNKTITERTKQALQSAKSKGIKVVLCTGRALTGVKPILEELNMFESDDLVITYNGGVIQKTQSGEILFQDSLSLKDIEYILSETQKVQLPINMLDLSYVYEPEYPLNRPSLYKTIMPILNFQPYHTNFDQNHLFNKVVICIEKQILDTEFNRLPKEFTERFNCVKSRPILMEVLPKKVHKGAALEQLAKLLNVELSEIMACGDEANDLTMIKTAGFGVAMGNAVEELKSVANYITSSNDEDGVAKAIEYLLKKESEINGVI